jgi:hypothetical protein
MADVYDTDSLNKLTKDRFAPAIKDRIPSERKFFKRLSMLKNGTLGKKYQQPLETQLPQGITYAAANAGPFEIDDMEPGALETAEVESNQFLFADAISYEEEARAKKNGEEAYTSAVGRVVKRAMLGFSKRVELSFMYGGATLGLIESRGATAGPDSDGNYSRALVIYEEEWASGIWLGMKKAKLDIRTTSTNTNGAVYVAGTKRNSGVVKIKSVSVVSRTITIVGSEADCNAAAVDDCLVFASTYGKETMGLYRIASNEGTLYGLDATELEEQLAGNVYDVGSRELTLRRIYEGQNGPVSKGLEDVDVAMYLNPLTFANLLANEVALRRYYEMQNGEVKTGLKNLKFQGQHGLIEFIPYINIKQGQAICGPLDTMAKVGAQDITMMAPGRKDGEFWKAIEGRAGYEMRLYANLGLFCDVPAYWTVYTNITNNL